MQGTVNHLLPEVQVMPERMLNTHSITIFSPWMYLTGKTFSNV